MLKFGLFVLTLIFVVDWLWLIISLFVLSLAWFVIIRYDFGILNLCLVDHCSFFLILLRLWITSLMILVSLYIWDNKIFELNFLSLSLFILIFLIFSFSTSDFLLFYILFEASLIPIFMLIMGWGYQPERLLASYYLLFYTLIASLPLLLSIFWLENSLGSLVFYNLFMQDLKGNFLFWVLIVAFIVKIPVYLIHLWLPRAHVEAPVAGSMILAGVLLKLGGYGLLRIFEFMYKEVINFSELLIVLGLIGGVLASFVCLCQSDVKSLVAYSSVSHMAVVISGLSSISYLGWSGSIVIMIAHGLCSSGLFALVGLAYSRLSRRSIFLIRGGLSVMPLLALWWFLFRIFNIAAPPSSNLAGEIFVFITCISWLNSSVLILALLSFIGAAYSLFLFSSTQHGNISELSFFCYDSNCREHLVLSGHFIFLFLSLFILVGLFSCYYSLKRIQVCGTCGMEFPCIAVVSFVYRKIYVFLLFLSLYLVLFGIYLDWQQKSFFVEWILGGGGVSFSVTFFFDKIVALFLSTVFFISSNVVIYSQSYIDEDIYKERFILIVFGFVISIFLLIVRPNILRILLGWDGLGLVSYCLVIYYSNKKSNSAGILTVLRNRVGDVCLLITIAWFTLTGDFVYFFLVDGLGVLNNDLCLSLLIVFAAITKSAQIPFSAWLPAAIAAPTPVSALVHSSTLVTAGVYLLIRFSSFLPNNVINLLFLISILTIFIAGLVASFEYDLKKIIALSTLSQLGVIIFALSIGLTDVAFFHLITHALFKAILFLCAGVLIHGVVGSQDIRDFGSIVTIYPLVGVCLNLANLSLCGLPFISGFYSKDLIVELSVQGNWSIFIIIILYCSLALTVYYSLRLTYFAFITESWGGCIKLLVDNEKILMIPIINLSLCSLLTGPYLSNFLLIIPSFVFLPFVLKTLTLIIILMLRMLFICLHKNTQSFVYISRNSSFHGLIWGLPILSGQVFSLIAIKKREKVFRNLDLGWLEWLTVGSFKSVSVEGRWSQTWQRGLLKSHFLIIIFWILMFFIWFY